MRTRTVIVCCALISGLVLAQQLALQAAADGGHSTVVAVAPAAPSIAPTLPPAATMPADPDAAPLAFARQVYDAVMHGQWWLAAALALVGAVALLRRLGAGVSFLHTDHGGALLTLGTAFAGALATALLAGRTPGAHVLLMALGIAVAAMGGYSGVWKRVLLPLWRSVTGGGS